MTLVFINQFYKADLAEMRYLKSTDSTNEKLLY